MIASAVAMPTVQAAQVVRFADERQSRIVVSLGNCCDQHERGICIFRHLAGADVQGGHF
jgi:hypothetical protein